MQTEIASYPWATELEKTVTQSLCTSFGLDFMLFEDTKGGNVDTIHNVRQDIWATEGEQTSYKQRAAYDSDAYHHNNLPKKESTYKTINERDGNLQKNGDLHDPYRNRSMAPNEKRNLDHTISAKEIHDDPGRVLAELDGVELANQPNNLQSTSASVNQSKKEKSIDSYLGRLPNLINDHNNTLVQKQKKLAELSRDTPQQQHEARKLESEIQKLQNKIDNLNAIDPDEMRKRDRKARAEYERTINIQYYTSSKFIGRAARDAGPVGLRMGTRAFLV